ncbi:MAG: hypothetical protein E6700_09785 [Winkia neuii]|uniref:hypothetical protein n=1 Tax=Winkia neuii TaxID=33007 RepID=UPI000B0CA557|nr:hypothetical protein [Winkia neuii]MDK8099794.1 hypothetical protein [Winkia neuii]MDU3135844.1 hypothetical protein [Winkia neuii]
MMLEIPSFPDSVPTEKHVVNALWPHLDDEWRELVRSNAYSGEFWEAMCCAIDGAYWLRYRVPEELLRAVERECDEMGLPQDDPDRIVATRFNEEIRNFDHGGHPDYERIAHLL